MYFVGVAAQPEAPRWVVKQPRWATQQHDLASPLAAQEQWDGLVALHDVLNGYVSCFSAPQPIVLLVRPAPSRWSSSTMGDPAVARWTRGAGPAAAARRRQIGGGAAANPPRGSARAASTVLVRCRAAPGPDWQPHSLQHVPPVAERETRRRPGIARYRSTPPGDGRGATQTYLLVQVRRAGRHHPCSPARSRRA
jgi:hypothetical protein